jgi:hemin uptake protein HemP
VTKGRDNAAKIPEASEAVPAAVRIASSELFQGRRDVVIVHRGQEYRLHITKTDKLILTK